MEAPGLSASQTVHCFVAVGGLLSPHIVQSQLSAGFVGAFSPAAPQLNPFEGGCGGAGAATGADAAEAEDAPGLSASQTAHFNVAEGLLLSPHTEQSQFSAGLEGTFIPAAAQSKPPLEEAAGRDGPAGVLLADALEDTDALKSYVGSEETGTAFAAAFAFSVLGPAPGDDRGKSNAYWGSFALGIKATKALISSVVFMVGSLAVAAGPAVAEAVAEVDGAAGAKALEIDVIAGAAADELVCSLRGLGRLFPDSLGLSSGWML